jgi:hypothetical protein
VVIASAVRIVYIRALTSYTDLLNSIWRIVVCGQVIQVTSIMTATIPFLKPFLTSLESSFLSANTASRTATSAHNTTGETGHLLSYVRLGSSQSPGQSERKDKQGNIRVRMDYVVQKESKLGGPQLKEAENSVDRSRGTWDSCNSLSILVVYSSIRCHLSCAIYPCYRREYTN